MSKKEESSHLKYGQGILIEGFKTQGEDKGFLTAQGFADIKSKYETYDDLLFFKNYRNSIFQILPAGNFQLNDELQQALIENEGHPDTPNITILKARAESERNQFQLNIENNQQKKVCFGHNVIFKHVDSEAYVSGTIKPSTGSNGAFTVQVSEKLSQSLVFKLLPFRSFEFLDMSIPFDSPILIRNLFNNGYMTYEKVGMGDSGNARGTYIEKKAIESNESYRIPVKTQSQKSDIYEVVTHFVDLSVENKEVPMPWRFKLHVNHVVNDTLIQHDVVYLQHTENNGVLSTQGQDIILKELKEQSDGLAFYECLWEIEKHDATQDSYILRHLMSGMVLGEKVGEDNIRRATLKDISEGKKEGEEISYVQVKLAKKEGGDINSDSFVNLAFGEELLEINEQGQNLAESVNKSRDPNARVDQQKMRALYKKNIEYNIKPLVFKKSVTNEHCFIIQEIDDDLKKELLFALSFHSVIIRLREDLQYGAIDAARKISYLRMMQVTNKIKEIKTFLKNCSEQESELQHIFPVVKRQMICKDLGISELLFELLYFMKENLMEDIFSDKHNQREKFLELYNTLYEVIGELIRNNILFKMHVSKWFEFILEDVIKNDELCQLALLKELLKDNQFFVNNFISSQIIQYLTENYIVNSQNPEFTEIKYLQIFRLLCLVGTQVNTHNQKMIIDHFLNVLRNKKSIYEVQLTLEDGTIMITASLDKISMQKLPFSQFRDKCLETNPSAWNYFVQYLNLNADLAQGRNKESEQRLKDVFTLDLLGDLFEKETLYEAEVPIIRLIHYLYAQNQNYYPIEKKRKILNYNTIHQRQNISIVSTPSFMKPWEPPFDRVLATLMAKLKTYGPISPAGEENYQKNLTLHTLLKILWETVNLGFWHDKSSVKELLTDVLHVVSKSEDIQSYEDVAIESKENTLMIKCKIECLNIIELISEYDNDIIVQFLAASFKDMEFPQKKFSLKGMFSTSPMLEIKCDHQLVKNYLETLPSEQSIQPILETAICDQMIQLSNYNNPKLTAKAMSIIDRVLQTKQKAFQHLYALMIISQEERLSLIEFMDQHRNKFFILEDKNIVNVTEDNQSCNYYMVSDKENMGLMQIIYLLTELMKNENSVANLNRIKGIHESGTFQALGSNRLINFTGERSSTNQMKQQIVYSANLHLKVLEFIFACTDFPESDLALKLLHMSYYFIVSIIENFNQIKAVMQWHIPKMIHHIKKNVGCIDFLKEMYDNNKVMLYNQTAVFALIKQICQIIQEEDEENYYKSKLLDFFRYLIYCNGRSLRNHQIQILKIMQDDSYSHIMPKIDEQLITQLITEYEEANASSNQAEMTPKLTYIYTYFQILTSLIDNNNPVNIGKLVKKYPFDLLVSFLQRTGTCWPLKRNIRAFINRLYYFRSDINTKLKSILDRELTNIINDLDYYLNEKYSGNNPDLENKKLRNPVRFSYIESYHYLLIEETIFTTFTLATQSKLVTEMANFLNNANEDSLVASYNWIKITERLACLQQYFTSNKNIYSNSMIKYILSKIKPVLLALTQKSIFERGMPERMARIQTINEEYLAAKQALVNKIIEGNISHLYKEKNPVINEVLPITFSAQIPEKEEKKGIKRDENRLKQALRAIFRRQKKDFNNEDERIEYNLTQLVSSIKLSPEAQKYMGIEYLQKVSTYYHRSDRFDYISKIIELNSKDSSALSTQHKLFFLKYIIGLVQDSNSKEAEPAADQPPADQPPAEEPPAQEPPAGEEEEEPAPFKTDIDEWQAEEWSGNAKTIVSTQKKLKKCQLGKFIVNLLKEDIINNIQLANSILLCAISYLLGGNPLTQKNILQELENDSDNKVFQNLEKLIVELGKLISKNINEAKAQQQQISGDFTPDTVDNYDYYDVNQKYTLRKNVFEPNSTDQYLYNKLCITTYRRAFKFLQLLCENNNKEGKNFIRCQPGKARQYNFIDITTKQLRNLFQIYCLQIKEVPLFLLDFILEVTQIPIAENQQALMSSTFFEDLCQLKNTFTTVPNILSERNFKNTEDVQAIYYLSIKIILSNFEGNKPQTFKILDSKLQAKFLLDVMKEKLAAMKISNHGELIDHIKAYSNKNQEKSSPEDEDRKNTGFDDQILILLDISTIFLKMRDFLGESSRIFTNYQKYKKQLREEEKGKIDNDLLDQGVSDAAEREKQVEEQLAEYHCMYTYLEKCLLNIEIADDKGADQVIYFPKYPVFSSLTGNLRDYIMKQVNRNSHRDKIVSLLSFTEGVKEKIQASYNLQKFKKITEKNLTDSFNIAAYLSLIICFFIFYFYHVNIEYQNADYETEYILGLIRFILSIVQLTFTILYVFYWFELKLWYNPEPQSRTLEEEEEVGEEEEAPAEEPAAVEQAPAEGQDAPPADAPPADAPPVDAPAQAPSALQNIKNKVQGYTDKVGEYWGALNQQLASEDQRIYKNIQFWRNMIFLGSSIVGTFYFPPMFFLHLIDIFAQIQKLGTILYSAIYNAKSIILVSIMGVFFTIIFCTVTFSNYMKNVYSPSDSVDDMCDGVMNCVSQLYVSGAIGQTMEQFQITRYIYDLIYFIFFEMLFGNIVSGLMLDAFASLREEADNLQNDKKNSCYICNMSRELIEKKNQNFDTHTKKKHFLWNYIFYIYVLERKNETDYTGLEYYIRQQYYKPDEEMQVKWIPNKGESEFDVQAEATILSESLQKKQEDLEKNVVTLEESISEFKSIAKDYLE